MNSEQCKRKNRAMRQRINELLREGFVIATRDPIRVERWPQVYEACGPVLNEVKRR